MRRVTVICNVAEAREAGLAYLRAAIRDCLVRGEAPASAWGFYPWAVEWFDDPDLVARALEAALAWEEASEAVVVYEDLGVTEPMGKAIERCERAGRSVERRKIGWSARPAVGSRVRVRAGIESHGGLFGRVIESDNGGRVRFLVRFEPLTRATEAETWIREEDLEIA